MSNFRPLQHFEHPGRAHAAADAHGDAHPFGAAPLALDERVAGQALARDAVGVAERDRAAVDVEPLVCLLYTSPSPRDRQKSRMPSSA